MSIITATDVPTELLAVQLYDPDLFLFIFGIAKVGPLWSTLARLSVLNHFHSILIFGFAAATVHSMVAVSSSKTVYGLAVADVTSGLSISSC